MGQAPADKGRLRNMFVERHHYFLNVIAILLQKIKT